MQRKYHDLSTQTASPIGKQEQRSKRDLCAENDDRCLEDSYWKEVLPLGFFINSNAVTGGGGGAPATGTKRGMDHGPLSYGSGSGHMIQRSDIPGQKAQNAQASEQTVKASPAVVKADSSQPAVSAPPPAVPAADSNKVGILFKTLTFCRCAHQLWIWENEIYSFILFI